MAKSKNLIENNISYDHLKEKLVGDKTELWNFNNVKNIANKNKLKLSNRDFERLFKLSARNKDIEWIISHMVKYRQSLVDALVDYIGY